MSEENIDEGRVEKLLKGAGRRTPMPIDVRDRLEESFRSELKSSRQKRTLTRWSTVSGIAAMLLVALFVDFDAGTDKSMESVAQVSNGTAIRHFGQERISLARGSKIYPGEKVVTHFGPLSIQPGSSEIDIRIAANSEVVFEATNIVALHSGSIYVDSHPDANDAPLQVVVDDLYIRHIGTQFLVTKNHEMVEVSVREGIVQMVHDEKTITSQPVQGAELTRFDKGDLIDVSPIAPYDERWAWVVKLTPEIETQDLHLTNFMDWISRQTGYDTEYQIALTDDHRITGSINTIDALDAMGTAMSIMGLKAEIDETSGLIVVSNL